MASLARRRSFIPSCPAFWRGFSSSFQGEVPTKWTARDKDTMTTTRKKVGMPNRIDKHVGSRVRLRRVMLNVKQTDLARRLGLSYQQVQKYERGTNRIGASRLQQISRILQVPVAFFFEGAPGVAQSRTKRKDRPLPDYVIEFLSTSDGHALAKAFTRMRNIKLRRRIVRLAIEVMGRM